MTSLALTIPQSGFPNSTEDVKVANDLTSIQNWANGHVDGANFAPGVVLQLAATGTARKVSFGSQGWVAAGTLTESVTFAHGLGVIPQIVMVVPNANWAGFITIGTADASAATFQATLVNISTGGTVAFTGGSTYNFNWIAIG